MVFWYWLWPHRVSSGKLLRHWLPGAAGCIMLFMTACSSWQANSDTQQATAIPSQPIVLRVSGYAAMTVAPDKVTLQHRLLAMRASKLDAYRTLAEQLYGASVYGDSQVDKMVLTSDRYKTLVDTSVRGARVVEVKELQEGGYETILELQLKPDFNRCLSLVNQFRFDDECRVPMPMGEDFSAADAPPVRTSGSLYSIAADMPKGE
jgi:hypothetical protein